jgi:NAD(P)-dependent dehydrogenase (short-subunit alcohol dehydrogenase family)
LSGGQSAAAAQRQNWGQYMSDPQRYDGKRVIVTGAASGMGAATAEIVAGLGAEVLAVDLRKPTVEGVRFLETDLSRPASIEATVAEIDGPVDALFNCAGLPNTFPGQQVMTVNFLGLRHLTELVLPLIPPGGAVASISSVAGMNFMAHMGELAELYAITDFDAAKAWCEAHDELVNEGYSLSKEAIVYYTTARSLSALHDGVRINVVSPGPTDTPMMPAFEEAMGKEYMDAVPKPIGRNAKAHEPAWAMVFLNSDAASYISGHNLMVDGGFLAAAMTGQIDLSAMMPTS